jgi:hypothetical protein
MWAAWYGELPVVKLLLQVPGIQVGIEHAQSSLILPETQAVIAHA